jgi:hypothetical protein
MTSYNASVSQLQLIYCVVVFLDVIIYPFRSDPVKVFTGSFIPYMQTIVNL